MRFFFISLSILLLTPTLYADKRVGAPGARIKVPDSYSVEKLKEEGVDIEQFTSYLKTKMEVKKLDYLEVVNYDEQSLHFVTGRYSELVQCKVKKREELQSMNIRDCRTLSSFGGAPERGFFTHLSADYDVLADKAQTRKSEYDKIKKVVTQKRFETAMENLDAKEWSCKNQYPQLSFEDGVIAQISEEKGTPIVKLLSDDFPYHAAKFTYKLNKRKNLVLDYAYGLKMQKLGERQDALPQYDKHPSIFLTNPESNNIIRNHMEKNLPKKFSPLIRKGLAEPQPFFQVAEILKTCCAGDESTCPSKAAGNIEAKSPETKN